MKKIVIYPGRFQPFSPHHKEVIEWIKSNIDADYYYIVTSDKTDSDKNPLNFKEKKYIIDQYKLSNVDIVQVKNPYKAEEVLKKFNEDEDIVIFIYGSKDSGRLQYNKKDGSKGYFQKYDKENLKSFKEHGYVITVPNISIKLPDNKEMSGTNVRSFLKNASQEEFKKLMGFYNKEIYNKFKNINEASTTPIGLSSDVDDGPRFFYGNQKSYKISTAEYAKKIGYSILDYISGNEEFFNHNTEYPNGPHLAVSYFPVGDKNSHDAGTNYYDDITTSKSYKDYKDWVIKLSKKTNMNIIDILDDDDKKSLIDEVTRGDSFWKPIFENIRDNKVGPFYHATSKQNIESIKKNGLKKKNGTVSLAIGDIHGDYGNYVFEVWLDEEKFYKYVEETTHQIIADIKHWTYSKEERELFNKIYNNGIRSLSSSEKKYLKTTGIEDAMLGAELLVSDNIPPENIKLIENKTNIHEGGAAGHLNHPYDKKDLTFNDINRIIVGALQGKLDFEKQPSEKTDGQNILVTYKDGKIKAARNKSTVINPMDVNQLKNKFDGRGDIYDAFAYAIEDLENALIKLKKDSLSKFFNNGLRFLNIEIIYPKTKNIVVYGPKSFLQLHGMIEFDNSGNKIKNIPDAGSKLYSLIDKVNSKVQKNFEIIPPKNLKINKDKEFNKYQKYFLNKVKKLQSEFNLKDTDEVIMYHEKWWENYIKLNLPNLDEDTKNSLLKRWAYGDKSNRIIKSNFENEDDFDKAINIDKKDHKQITKDNINKFEMIFLELGVRVLQNVEEFLSAVPKQTYIKDIKKQVVQVKNNLKDPSDLEKMKDLFKKINQLGGFEKIVPSEGLVFYYKGSPYKLTGLFSPINQLLGMTRYL